MLQSRAIPEVSDFRSQPISMNMFRYLRAAFCVFVCLFDALAFGQTPPIRIMPLGDSITDGSSFDSPDGTGGYRGPLYSALTGLGYNVDYIGSLTINSGLLVEKEHEGHSGWRIDQLDTNMEGWLNVMPDPDVVLMHIGTNDFGQNFNINTAIDRLDGLILKIATLRPYAHIIVTNLMERSGTPNTNIQALFNPYVQDRVNAHAAAGRRVTFLDMYSAVPLADMPDQLHPDQNGYNKMAAAWLPAIQAVIGVEGDNAPPVLVRAVGATNRTQLAVTFSKPIAEAAAVVENFSINGGLSISAASLDASKRVVTLTTSVQAIGTPYTVTVNHVQDRITPTPNTIAANSTISFLPAIPRGYLNHIPESSGYTLALSLDVPNAALWRDAQPGYGVDNRHLLGTFDRIAYYVELQSATGQLQYLWASMDAFTADVQKIGVPVLSTGATFQQSVSNLTVVSNAPGIVNGAGLTGNIEFWPTNYAQANSAGVPGASGSTYDFGDQPNAGTYGSMQIHNTAAGQTLFALNNWGAGSGTPGDLDIGIGNDPAPVNGGVDWTFHHNAAGYTVKSVQVLVRNSTDSIPPTLTAAKASFGLSRVVVTFSEPISAASVEALNFSIDHGVSVLSATPLSNPREVVLTTTLQPSGTPLTLTVNNVRDTSPNANRIAPNSTIAIGSPVLPPEIVNNVGALSSGYQVVYSANLPVTGNFNSQGLSAYSMDESAAFGPFSRVAYYLELQQAGGPVQYVWASMDAFTINRKKIGLPTLSSGAVFQQGVTNLEVLSNVAGVANGTTVSGGNIEFWPTDYSAPNGASVPGANAATYDFGDTRSTTGGYGSMQIHNNAASQTVMAINRFGTDGATLDLGIGNNPSPVNGGVDWTFASNAGNYTRRVLHVLVLPAPTTAPAVVANVPEAANYQLVYSLNLPTAGNLVGGAGFANYAVNNSADVGGFSRVAYYLELQKTGDANPRYIWTSMDAFTPLASRIGVPTPASGAVFQQTVSNLNVASNVAGVTTGTGITTGNIEFWPTNYTQATPAGVLPGNPGNTGLFDYNDTRSTTGTHGSFQVHNYGAGQTLWGINNWGTSANTSNILSMGIGNNPTAGQAPDYTLSNNGTSWDIKRVLHVYVLPSNSDNTPPSIVRAVGSPTLNRFVMTFSEAVAESASNLANFSIPGLTVDRTELLTGGREMAIYTSAQTPGTSYTVNVSGVRDRSPAGNLIASAASATFTAYTGSPVLANVEAGYSLVYQLAIPSATPQWNVNAIPYSVDEAKYGERLFDRVAYLLELDSNWVYASFDRHTTSLAKTGVPTLGVTSTPFQQVVTNMNVASNVAGIVTGTGITTGNIEFWGGNYTAANANNIPNASAATFDFGDQMTTGGHGSMQIHNHGASQVLMAYNNWGGNTAQMSDLGIGNYPTPSTTNSGAQLDWTFTSSASASTVRNLYVFVRPGGTASGPSPSIYGHPTSRTILAGTSTTLSVLASGPASLTYQWRKGGIPLPGETKPWLDLNSVTVAAAGSYDVVVTGGNFATATSLTATVIVNTAPTFAGYSNGTLKGTPLLMTTSGILAGANDADGDLLSISGFNITSTQGGTVASTEDGLLYTPSANFSGTDGVALTITDTRGASVAASLTITVSDISDPAKAQTSVARNGDGSVDIGFHGIPGRTYLIQRSVNLLNWTNVQTLTPLPNGDLPFHDGEAPADKAFYRTMEVP